MNKYAFWFILSHLNTIKTWEFNIFVINILNQIEMVFNLHHWESSVVNKIYNFYLYFSQRHQMTNVQILHLVLEYAP